MYRVLHRTFCTFAEESTTAAATTTNIKSISQDLFKEKNLKTLVDKFKKASDITRFRKKTGIYEDTVRRLAGAKRFRWVRDIIEHQKNYSDISNEGFSARLITLYGKSKMHRHAQKLFDEMPQRNCNRSVLSLNALLAAYLHSKQYDVVERLFKELPDQLSVKPDLVSYNTYIKALLEMGSYDSAVSVVDEMEKNGVNTDLITFNTLLDGLYSNGRFEDGEKLWEKIGEKNVTPDIRTHNARLLGLAVAKKTGEAVEFYEEMEKKGLKPDIFSFNALIKGFADEGNLDEAKKWFDEIGKSEYEPGKGTYSIILPFLCEKGDLKTAFEMVKNIFYNRCRVDVSLLQLVVDKMVSESMVAEAKEIVEQGKKNSYCRYKLNLPADE
jgi:pentatricopeptide repeat protein